MQEKKLNFFWDVVNMALLLLLFWGRRVALEAHRFGAHGGCDQFPQSSSIHLIFLRRETKQWGWLYSQKPLLLLTHLSTMWFLFLLYWLMLLFIILFFWGHLVCTGWPHLLLSRPPPPHPLLLIFNYICIFSTFLDGKTSLFCYLIFKKNIYKGV